MCVYLLVAALAQAKDTMVMPPPGADLLLVEHNANERSVSARQVNLFHVRFRETVVKGVPVNVTFAYAGIVAFSRGREGQHGIGNEGMPLSWRIGSRSLNVFTLSITTRPGPATVCETFIEGQRLFLNVENAVCFVDLDEARYATVDEPLPELGGLSVRQALAKLNEPRVREQTDSAAPAAERRVASPPAEPTHAMDRFGPPVTPRVILKRPRELSAQYRADERVITARQVNLFHLRFIETVMDDLPRLVALDYQGLVATVREQGRPRKAGDIGLPLSWALGHDGRAVCTFWLSTQPTPETAGDVPIEGQKLFVNVDSVIGNSGLDIPLPELGNLTVRQTLAKLNNPWPITLEDLQERAKKSQ